MKSTSLITHLAKLIILFILPLSAYASTIETLSSWNGSGIGNFGEDSYGGNIDSGVYATYGQTFYLSSGNDNILQSISFYVNDNWTQSNPIHFGIYLYEWNGSSITGNSLFESQPLSTNKSNDYEKFTVNTGGIFLNTNTSYVAFMSASNYFDGNIGYGQTGYTSNSYLEGGYVYMNNKDDFIKLSTSSWASNNDIDLAFQLDFTPVPIPSSLWIFGSGLISLLGFVRYKKSNMNP